MHIDKLYFSTFIYKMSCLEFTYSLIQSNEKNADLSEEEQAEIEWIIDSALHRKLYASRKKSLFSSKIKIIERKLFFVFANEEIRTYDRPLTVKTHKKPHSFRQLLRRIPIPSFLIEKHHSVNWK